MINFSSVVQFSSGTCYKSVQISHSSGTMLDGGSLASHSSQHVGRCSYQCLIIKVLIMDVSVGHMLRDLPLLPLILWLLRVVCCTCKDLVSSI